MKESHCQKILYQLKQAGKDGVHGFELSGSGGWRYAARIYDLKRMGYTILSCREKMGETWGSRYYLLG